jgi:type III secretion protein D
MQHAVADDRLWRFEIAGGPNAGASVTLAPGRYRLGSNAANDIVLADPAVSPSHAVLDLAPGRAGITALVPGVMLQRRRLPSGASGTLASGTVVTLGATRLRFAGPPAASRRSGSLAMAMSLALAAVVGAGAAYRIAAPIAARTAVDAPPAIQPAAAGTLNGAAAALRTHLAARHLASGLQITAIDGVVLATGRILPQDRTAWLAAEQWFDARFGTRYALADRVGTATPGQMPQLQVSAVAMAPVPNVITRDGQHYTVGAVLKGGWSVDRITPHAITLRCGAREIRIAL